MNIKGTFDNLINNKFMLMVYTWVFLQNTIDLSIIKKNQ